MFSLTCKLSLTMAAAVAFAILTASIPASSDEPESVNLGPQTAVQPSLPYKAFDGLKNDHDRFATKVDPPQGSSNEDDHQVTCYVTAIHVGSVMTRIGRDADDCLRAVGRSCSFPFRG